VVALALLGLAGCGESVKTYPVRGKVVLTDGNIKQLDSSHVEFMLESDNTVRASGLIGPDGDFEMQSVHDGKVRKGAPEGTYRARIYLSNEGDDDDGRKRRPPPVHPRFLDFKTSDLSFQVPTDGDITVTVSRR
jgi:hypothetical protein